MPEKKAKILVVDDEKDIVETLKHFLSLKGYEVIGAFSGEEALSILEKEKIELILLDIMMPGLKGTEVAKIVKKKYPDIKLIVVTGYPGEVESVLKEKLLEGTFLKPVRIQGLYNKLAEILSQKETPTLDLKSHQGIKARLLLIKAKLLFIEPTKEVYNFLSAYFKKRSNQGEDYELDVAENEESMVKKIHLFNPDIVIVNTSYFKEYNEEVLLKNLTKKLSSKEIIVYNIKNIKGLQNSELKRLIKSVQIICLKNGFIEIKWIEI